MAIAKDQPQELAESLLVESGRSHGDRVEYNLQLVGRQYNVYFSCVQLQLTADAEAALAMVMLGAMNLRLAVCIKEPISHQFLHNQQQLMMIFCSWFERYHFIEITASRLRSASPVATQRVGCFFTGGVDSFYSFLKHRDDITDLIFVHGYDVDLNDLPRRAAISAMGQALERATGIRFIELETNAIRLFRDFGRWGLHAHGYGLGSAARHLAGYLRTIYIPSSFSHTELMPWASHPQTDPLFSDERLEVIHDGCEVGRVGKVRGLANDPLALRHLRVCWERVEGAYNCGRCEKCLRTMTSLQALGVLHQCATFPSQVDLRLVRELVIYDASLATFVRDNLRLLEECGQGASPLADAWRKVLERAPWQNRIILRWRKWCRRGWRLLNKMRRAR